MPEAAEGSILWEPTREQREKANVSRYLQWLRESRGLSFATYDELWRWSVGDIESFWASIWDFFEITASRPYERALSTHSMPGAHWFPGAKLNHAEHALRRRDDHPALLFGSEEGPLTLLSYAQLAERVGAASAGLRRLGLK